MAKKIDFKQFFLQHGERVGLVVAGVLAVLLLVLSLFMPGHGFFSGSAKEMASKLDVPSDEVEKKLNDPRNVPGEKDKPPLNADAGLVTLTSQYVDPSKFQIAGLIPVDPSGTLGRRNPRVLTIEEAIAKSDKVNLRCYVMPTEGTIIMLESEGGSGSGNRGSGSGGFFGGGGRGGPGGPAGPMGGPGGGRGGGLSGSGGMSGGRFGDAGRFGQAGDSKKEKKPFPVALVDVEKNLSDKKFAEQLFSQHVGVIAASFPYKKQIEEFRAKLSLRSNQEVFSENSTIQGPDKTPMPAFRFIGVNVERRELDDDGKPISAFAKLDLREYGEFLYLSGRRLEPEDPTYAPVSYPGLVMPKLFQFRMEKPAADAGGSKGSGAGGSPPVGGSAGGSGAGSGATPAVGDPEKDRYPRPEKELKLLDKALNDLKGKDPASVAKPPKQFQRDPFDPFAPDLGAGNANKDDSDKNEKKTEASEFPEYCLARVLDVTVQPGKTYEYRLQVRMSNPNYGRNDVANPAYAQSQELLSDWFLVPTPMSVDPDLYYYAVEQKDLDADAKDPYRRRDLVGPYNRDRVIVLQAHRFVPDTPLKGSRPIQVGEWSVAERMPVLRGEYIGRNERAEVPYWKYTLEDFAIALDASSTRRSPGIDVLYGYNSNTNQPEAILVDFDNGRHLYERVTSRVDDDVKMRKVGDTSAVEVLIFNTEGKLSLLEGAEDAREDSHRTKRLAHVRDRIREVRDGIKPKSSKDPFGK